MTSLLSRRDLQTLHRTARPRAVRSPPLNSQHRPFVGRWTGWVDVDGTFGEVGKGPKQPTSVSVNQIRRGHLLTH